MWGNSGCEATMCQANAAYLFSHTHGILTHVCAARLSQKRTLSCVMFSRDIWFPACSVFLLNCDTVSLDVHSAIFAHLTREPTLTVRVVCFVVGTASEVVTQQGQCNGYGAILASTMDGVLSRSCDVGVRGLLPVFAALTSWNTSFVLPRCPKRFQVVYPHACAARRSIGRFRFATRVLRWCSFVRMYQTLSCFTLRHAPILRPSTCQSCCRGKR